MKRRNDDTHTLDDLLASHKAPPADEMRESIELVAARLRTGRDDARLALALEKQSASVVFSRARWRSAVAAAVLLTAAVGTAIVWPRGNGDLYRVVEGTVQTGGIIRTNDAGAQLALVDGSRVEVRSQSELTVERADDGLRIRLSRGDIIVNAATQRGGHLYVQTKDITVTVVGTVFLVNAGPEGSRVAVIEGEVRVQQGATEQKLRTGDQVVTNPSMPSMRVTEEVAWSRQAETHVARLQQTASARQTPAVPAAQQAPAFEVVTIRPHGSGPGGGRSAGGGGGGMNPFAFGCAGSVEIDPRRFARIQTTIWDLITVAYSGNPNGCRDVTLMNVISGGPDWIKSDFWDVVALIPEGVLSAADLPRAGHWRNEKPSTLQKMVERLLIERVGFAVRREIREVPAYALKMVGAAPRFTPPPLEGSQLEIWKRQWDTMASGRSFGEPGGSYGKDVYMKDVIELLGGTVGRPIADETGFTGSFSFRTAFRPPAGTSFSTNSRLAGFPDIFTALEQQVGLRLEETTAKTEFWVIESISRPTEN